MRQRKHHIKCIVSRSSARLVSAHVCYTVREQWLKVGSGEIFRYSRSLKVNYEYVAK